MRKPQLKPHFSIDWQENTEASTRAFLDVLTQVFERRGTKRRESETRGSEGKKRREEGGKSQEEKKQNRIERRKRRFARKHEAAEDGGRAPNNFGLNFVCIGLSEVLRLLQSGKLSAAFLDAEILRSGAFSSLLGTTFRCNQTPVYRIVGLSTHCAPLLEIRRVSAVGILKQQSVYSGNCEIGVERHSKNPCSSSSKESPAIIGAAPSLKANSEGRSDSGTHESGRGTEQFDGERRNAKSEEDATASAVLRTIPKDPDAEKLIEAASKSLKPLICELASKTYKLPVTIIPGVTPAKKKKK